MLRDLKRTSDQQMQQYLVTNAVSFISSVQLSSDEEAECEPSTIKHAASHKVTVVSEAHNMTEDDRGGSQMSATFVADDRSAAELENWLRQNVVVQYWKGERESRPNTGSRVLNIAVDWFVLVTSRSLLTCAV